MNIPMYPRNPYLTVDAVVLRYAPDEFGWFAPEILLVKRKREPIGWALPGGFVDYGESTKSAIIRELKEETGLTVKNTPELLCVRSDPDRDPRQHTVSVVYLFNYYEGELKTNDPDEVDDIKFFPLSELPDMVFDHKEILNLHLDWIGR
jgi:8-oxo-dGTP diphosphatase